MGDDSPMTDDELAALLAIDALEADEQADAELRLGPWPAELASAALPLAESLATEPPTDLRDAVLATALARRPAGRPLHSPESVTPAGAFGRTIDDLHALLTSLSPHQWDAVAHAEHGRVRDLVAHLSGVERLNARWLDPDDEVPYLPDHVASTQPAVTALAEAEPADVLREWEDAARAMLAEALIHDGADRVTFHDITVSVDGLLTMRTFELWAHGMDIAMATGLPLPMLDDARMQLMSSRLVNALAGALAYRGASSPGRAARFVLTGPAGGCYDVDLDLTAPATPAELADPDITIVADVVDLCRVAAARLTPEELSYTVDGDPALAGLVLANIDAFARD
jgi:uncharacterized protein (TIGR03083 family)